MPMIRDEGVCVRHWDWSETSQTLAVMTRAHGLLRCVAKGSKRERAPFSGGIELLTRGHLTAIVKPGAELATLTSWDLIEPMVGVRRSFARYAACMYAIDLIPRTVHDHDPHPSLHDALRDTLSALGGTDPCPDPSIQPWLAWFQWRVLAETGSKPEVAADVRTGEMLGVNDPVGVAWDLGGLTAWRGEVPGVARIGDKTARVLRALDAGTEPGEIPGSTDEITRCGRVLAALLRAQMSQEPPSLGWVYPEISGLPRA